MRKRRPISLAVLAAALALAAAVPTVASAHETWVFHGADSARVIETHTYIEIYDHECDAHKVHVRYRMSNGNLGQFTDNDGCGPNRAYRGMPGSIKILRFQLCEDAEGCSPIRVT